jgi:hypothetical protein
MDHRHPPAMILLAVSGDLVVFLVATILGFASHRELGLHALGRMAATWVPFSAAWFVFAAWLGLFDPRRMRRVSSLVRVGVASLIAAPVGAWLRSLWVRTDIVLVFVLVMAAVTTGLLLLWRGLLGLVLRAQRAQRAGG